MADFSSILKRGKKSFDAKAKGGKWGKCDECTERRLLFPYHDAEDEVWDVCEECMNTFIKEEEEE